MNLTNKVMLGTALLTVLAAAGAAWWLMQPAAHEHQLTEMTDAQGAVYFACPMHPQVRRAEPGSCPICGMKLVKREQPAMSAPGVAGAATGSQASGSRTNGTADGASASERGGAMPSSQGEVLYWYDPMRPDQHFDAPGRSPFMDMQLVPKYARAANEATVVRVSPAMVQNLGIRTAPVVRGTFWQRIDTTGRVEADERSVRKVTVRAGGWVEALHVRAEGDFVRRGQLLADIYSPALDAAQREYLLALQSGEPTLIDAAQAQLRALDIDNAAIADLRESRQVKRHVSVRAPMNGYVMTLRTRDGAVVQPDVALFDLVSHDPIWVIAEVTEGQSAWVAVGRAAEVRVPAHPNRVYDGSIDYLYPDVDAATRTRRVRLVLSNTNDELHPGMYADVVLFGGARRDVLLVPSEAVIRTGTRSVVIVTEAAGRYRPVAVRAGDERDGQTVVLAGLDAGTAVVTSGQFLIDSEASLLGAFNRMSDDGDPPAGRMRLLGENPGNAVYGDGAPGSAQRSDGAGGTP